MGRLQLYPLWLLLWLCLWLSTTAALATNATFHLEYPYTEAIPDMHEQVARCNAASQFSFRNGRQPAPAQLARMCRDPNCGAIANKFLEFGNTRTSGNASATVTAFKLFAVPMLNYCWYYRLPDDKCPENPLLDLAAHYKDKVDACARSTNVSYLEPNSTIFYKSMQAYVAVSIPILASGNTSLCPSECAELSTRVYYLYDRMPCVVRDSKDKDQRRITTANGFLFMMCNVPKPDQTLFGYVFQPDWPLPPIAESMPTPPTPGSHDIPPSSGSQDGSQLTEISAPSDEVSNDVEDRAIAEGIAMIEFALPSPKPRSRTNHSSAETEDTTGSTFGVPLLPDLSTAPTTASTTATLDSRSGDAKTPPERTENTELAVTTSPIAAKDAPSSGSKYGFMIVVIAVAAVAVVIASILFVGKRRRRAAAAADKLEIHDIDVATPVGTPATDRYSVMTDPLSSFSSRADNALLSSGTTSMLSSATMSSTWSGSGVILQKTIPTDSIKDIRLVGAGGSGVVFLVQDTRTNRLLASKRLAKNQLSTDKISAFHDEIQLVSKLDHPCIVSYIGATWTNRSDLQALFEYMDGGDLRTHLDSTPVEPWSNEKLDIAINIADALVYVHVTLSTPIVHRDLKSRNILLTRTPQLRAKLSDFGVARHQSQHESMTTGVGTSRWLAPEVIVGGGTYDSACDIYSFGVVLSELDTHRVPFADCRTTAGGPDSLLPEITILGMVGLDGLKPTFSDSCLPELLVLAQQCLSYNPRERPSAETVASELRRIRDGFV